jgi:hypothetical protein
MKIIFMITLLSILAPFKVFASSHTDSSISHERGQSVAEHTHHNHSKETAEGEVKGGDCDCDCDCCENCDCCKDGSDCCKDGCDCCKDGSDCCKDGCECSKCCKDEEINTPNEGKVRCEHEQNKN